MEGTLGNAIAIMVVGMVTVFMILWFVGIIGNIIIRLTNRYMVTPEPVITQINTVHFENPKNKVAAIVAAVELITGGNGHIIEIKKV
jgi:oxaloacetate decarboxylase (Na+ extruding) subunit gamma